MNIGIVGGGPAGLYFALLIKKRYPRSRIRVIEQNRADATYGWGVVFSGRALSYVASSDATVYRDIEAELETWDDQAIVHRGQRVQIDGSGFSGIERLRLLQILQDHCQRAGVELQFETRLTHLREFADCDLIVGADGTNSVVRQYYERHFGPSVQVLSNKYAWYGTNQLFDCLTLTFREHRDGAFVAHHYRYSRTSSTFIVECDAETWANSGLERMSEEQARLYCEDVFREHLGGHPLRSNKSLWSSFRVIRNRNWSHHNIVLIGDALRTVHFSIGSGTRMALEDAIALAHAFSETQHVPTALRRFEESRRPAVDKILAVAERSYRWYERMRDRMRLDPIPFAYDYLTRGGSVTPEKLRERSPRFMAARDAYLSSETAANGPGAGGIGRPFPQ